MGPDAAALAAELRDRRGRVASAELTVIDDGRLPGGALAAPCDGEGMPTRAVTLVEDGEYRQPLLAWHQAPSAAAAGAARASGCSRRASWRDLPVPGPTHLYVRPRRGPRRDRSSPASPAGTICSTPPAPAASTSPPTASSCRCAASRSPAAGRWRRSRARWLCGGAGALLRGVQAVARDLAFLPLDGMIGTPSLLVSGLELRPAAGDGPL